MAVKKANKAPLNWFFGFVFCYVGGYGVLNITNNINPNEIGLQIVILVICSFLCVYGLLTLVDDFKTGGIRRIINRIKGNGDT